MFLAVRKPGISSWHFWASWFCIVTGRIYAMHYSSETVLASVSTAMICETSFALQLSLRLCAEMMQVLL